MIRNYDEIYILYSKLIDFFPYIPIPKLQNKELLEKITKHDDEFYLQRLRSISFFLNFVNNNETLSSSQIFNNFIKSSDLDKHFIAYREAFLELTESKKFASASSQFVGFFKNLV